MKFKCRHCGRELTVKRCYQVCFCYNKNDYNTRGFYIDGGSGDTCYGGNLVDMVAVMENEDA